MNDQPEPLGAFEQRLLAELLVVRDEFSRSPLPSAEPPARTKAVKRLVRSGALAFAATAALAGVAFAVATSWIPALGARDRGSPSAATSPLPARLRLHFSVLTRPQSDLDRGPSTERALRLLTPGIVNEIHTDDIRVLRHEARRELTAILLPVGSYDTDARRAGAREGSGNSGLCLLLATFDRVTHQCYAPREATRIRLPSTNDGVIYGLVPDGVAAVQISYDRGRRVNAEVRDNLYLRRAPSASGRVSGIRWISQGDTNTGAALDE